MFMSVNSLANFYLFGQFIKFSIVGFLNTCLHFGIFYVLYHFVGVHYLLSSSIGYGFGLINSYFFNKIWTFRDQLFFTAYQFFKFVIVNLASLSVNLCVLYLLIEKAHFSANFSQVGAILFSLLLNFFGNKYFTFTVSGIHVPFTHE